MNLEQTLEVIKTLGVPVAILIWVFWRGDFFLRYLMSKLDKFNDELETINFTIKDLITQIKK